MNLTNFEKAALAEWIARMKLKEQGFFKRELPDKLVLVDWSRMPEVCKERLQARIQCNELKLLIEEDGLQIYEFVEKDK